MIKSKAITRKNATVLNEYTTRSGQQEWVHVQRGEDLMALKKENEMLTNQAQEANKREAAEADRNTDLMAEVITIKEEKIKLERLIITQEQKINSMQIDLNDLRKKNTTLSTTLVESEKLNRDISKKLNEYADRQNGYLTKLEELEKKKKQMEIDLEKQTEKLRMEKTKFGLLFSKTKKDEDNDKQNSQLKFCQNQLQFSQKEVKELKDNLLQRERNIKDLTLQISRKRDTKEMEETIQRCEKLEQELKSLKTKNNEKRLSNNVNTSEAIKQLEQKLLKKSAEYTALNITKNTLQNKVKVLDEENEQLKESNKSKRDYCEDVKCKLDLMTDKAEGFVKQKSQIEILEKEKNISQETEKKSKCVIQELQSRLEEFQTDIKQKYGLISILQNDLHNVADDCSVWKERYTKSQASILKLEYEYSDNGTLELQKVNQDLIQEISLLKRKQKDAENFQNQYQIKTDGEMNSLRERWKHERRSLEAVASQLQNNFKLAQHTIENERILEHTKERHCKDLLKEKSDLKARILLLEEKLGDSNRLNCWNEKELLMLKDENAALKNEIDHLNIVNRSMEKFQWGERQNIMLNPHYRTSSADSSFSTQYPFLRLTLPARKSGDGSMLLSDDDNKNFTQNVIDKKGETTP